MYLLTVDESFFFFLIKISDEYQIVENHLRIQKKVLTNMLLALL